MGINKFITLVVFACCLTYGQTTDTVYSVSAEFGMGYSRFLTTMDYNDLNKNGFAGSFKIMWNPEHLLSIGLYTGYQYLYSLDVKDVDTEFGNTDVTASMYTVPIFIAFAMKISPQWKLTAGSGMYLMYNSGSIYGDDLSSNQASIGAFAGIAYSYPLNNSISIGGELNYSYYSKIQDQSLALQFLFIYDFLKW